MLGLPWQWFLEPVNQRLFLSVVIALGIGLILGWSIRRATASKARSYAGKGDEAFFRGIQYILSNDHDQAIEEFTKSVQVNSDTIETYMALGNLFRSKGDIDRAIRIRQSIILRPNMDEKIKLGALFELGLDYRKGGFLNRALDIFLKLAPKDGSNVKILQEIERIYEEMKDWENAYNTRKSISRLTKSDHRHILAHHQVEMGKVHHGKGDFPKAISFFQKAISTHAGCVDAYLHLGDLYFGREEHKLAISTWKRVVEVSPRFTFLAFRRLEGAYARMKNLKPVEEFLKDCVKEQPDAFTHLALARYLYNENDVEGALKEIRKVLDTEPSLWEARRFRGEILLAYNREKDALTDYRELIDHLDMPYMRFQCEQCGFQPKDLQWQCPKCRNWDTINLIDSTGARSTPGSKPHAALGRSAGILSEE